MLLRGVVYGAVFQKPSQITETAMMVKNRLMLVNPVRCLISGCSPDSAEYVRSIINSGNNSVVSCALEELSTDTHEGISQEDVCVIGAIHPSGEPYYAPAMEDLADIDYDTFWNWVGPPPSTFSPETDIHVMPHCELGETWGAGHGVVEAPWPNDEKWVYCVTHWDQSYIMVQTFALDILGLATQGRMTALRLWQLAIQQAAKTALGFPSRLRGVHYGAIQQHTGWPPPEVFIRFTEPMWKDLENLGDVEVVKQRLVHEGKFWIWMAPDRFPVSSTEYDPPAPTLPKVHLSENSSSVFEKLPLDILISITSILPLDSLVTLASTSRLLRTSIFGNEQLARTWVLTTAPWWVPVPTRTPRIQTSSTTTILPYLASQSSPCRLSTIGLDWAYIRRCARSGSMRNRQRIWMTVLDIERVADLAGV